MLSRAIDVRLVRSVQSTAILSAALPPLMISCSSVTGKPTL